MLERSLSIVIPAFNESQRIISTLHKISSYIPSKFDIYEIIVVDDGSTDDTSPLVSSISNELRNIHLIKENKNRGKGFAVKKGVLCSSGSLVLYCDSDMSTPIEEMGKMLPWIERGYDIIVGSRGLKESQIIVRQPWYRELMGRIFNLFVQALIMRGIEDTQCGFKLLRGDVAREIFKKVQLAGFSFDVEALFIAKKSGFRIKEVPVQWANSSNSRVSIVHDPIKMFKDLFRIRYYWLTGSYKNSATYRD